MIIVLCKVFTYQNTTEYGNIDITCTQWMQFIHAYTPLGTRKYTRKKILALKLDFTLIQVSLTTVQMKSGTFK